MAESESSNPIAAAHAKAYKAYLQTLKESLADVDIEAVDVAKARTLPGLLSFYTYACYHTLATYACYHTLATINTVNSISTGECIE
jgi:hypothetical protein